MIKIKLVQEEPAKLWCEYGNPYSTEVNFVIDIL